MDPRQVATTDDVRQLLEERGLKQIKVGVFDIDGVMRGKYMARNKFLSSLEGGGFGFCDVVLGWDCQDQLYDNATLTGWRHGFGDAQVRLLLVLAARCRSKTTCCFSWANSPANTSACAHAAVLRRVIANAREHGFEPYAACEYEFLVVEETPQSLEDKGWRGLAPMGVSNAGYSVLRNSVNTEFYRGLLDLCEDMDIVLEGLHEETGPGALEAAISVDTALAAGDKAALFKTFAKVLAQRQGRNASFMAKWDAKMPGQGGHVHVSLKSLSGEPVFHDASQAHAISQTMRHFIGGVQRFAAPWLALAAPTVNSYRRLVPGYWAPTSATWGADNRTVAIRAITRRAEIRSGWSSACPGADCQPLSRLAAPFAAGLHGIESSSSRRRDEGNAYVQDRPTSCNCRARCGTRRNAQTSTQARESFGDAFVDHFAATREWEEREFRKHVTDWELKRYFEII